MRVLLTGGAGFIGSACLSAMLGRGWEVVVVDNFEPTLYDRARKVSNLDWCRAQGDFAFEEVDLRDADALGRVFSEYDIDHVVHMAAIAGVRPSITHAPRYYDVNVTGTATLLGVGRARGVTRFTLASSSSVYGGNTKVPFHEEDPVTSPISPYAASKRSMELLARTDHHLHGGDISCLRFFTVYGPRQRPEMAIHKFMRLLSDGEPIPMFGDGTSGRDYTYIDDIVQGVLGAVDHTRGFRVYNLGGDEVILLRDLISAIGRAVGVEPVIDQLPMQPGDVTLTNADVGRARQELGYEPQVDLARGLAQMWDWYQES